MLLADAVAELQEALEGDTGSPDVWTTEELEFLCENALAMVNDYRPRAVRDTIDLIADDDQYQLTNVYSVHRVDLLSPTGRVVMQLPPRSWEVWGQGNEANQTLWIANLYARDDYAVRVHGYAPWTWSATDFPYEVQQCIIAVARAEALRRLVHERSRFRQWATSNPRSDVSVTELLSMTNEADNYARELLQRLRTIKKPVIGRR